MPHLHAAVLALLLAQQRPPATPNPSPVEVSPAPAEGCVACHTTTSRHIVLDWRSSKHGQAGLGCETCHGSAHGSRDDVWRVKLPTPETCGQCHARQVEQYGRSKHALAWAAMKAMPTFHYQPLAMVEGLKGCGGCHKLGLKSDKDLSELRQASGGGNSFGKASCDACHTRHTFSINEARSPEACRTCHTGFDHPQWEMYSGSKHGVRHALKRQNLIARDSAAPTCQTCHMQEGNHDVHTAWGFLAVRLPMPEDTGWAADRATILQALGTGRLEALKAAQVVRVTQEEWQQQRDKMLATCAGCHSRNFAEAELKKGDDLIRRSDHLMAEAIRVVAKLYQDRVLATPDYAEPFPDLLTAHDAPSVPEQKLFAMFLEHRMRTFQGAFHNNPEYAFWYGWSGMVQDLAEIKQAAAELRERSRVKRPRPAPTAAREAPGR